MNKYKNGILFLLIIMICVFSFFNVKANDLPLYNKIIYIDPGHGGNDPGAIYKTLKESDLTLEISFVLKKILEENGATVYMTRKGNYDLSVINTNNKKRSDLYNRSKIINDSSCDLYLSIHLNADLSSTWSGAQVFYSDVNENNKLLATIIQDKFKSNLNTKRNISKIENRYLYKRIKKTGVLLELGFITNPDERYLLQTDTYQEKISKLIVLGIIDYFNI